MQDASSVDNALHHLCTTENALPDAPIHTPTVLLIGASRGLGYAMAAEFLKRKWNVVGTVRASEGRTDLHRLAGTQDDRVEIESVDITEPDQIAALRDRLADRTFDIVFVNAGTGNSRRDETIAEVSTEDFVRVIDPQTHEQSIVPFYKASFVWIMQRQTTDYFLRVVVPLIFILIVAYVSIFIPTVHFEAIVTIQVTALLSAVALYLSLPKLDADTATMSDRIFLFDYMMVSAMIAISVARVNRHVHVRKWLFKALGALHIFGVPLCVAAVAWLIWSMAVAVS